MSKNKQFFPRQVLEAGGKRWDWVLLPIVLALLVLLAYGAQQMSRPFQLGETLPLSLDPVNLPYYLLRTTLRMFIALAASMVFSCIFAALTVKYKIAEKVLVPLLDILQDLGPALPLPPPVPVPHPAAPQSGGVFKRSE